MYIQQPRLVEPFKGQRIIGIAAGPTQSFAWTDFDLFSPKTSLPFVIDLSENTFKYAMFVKCAISIFFIILFLDLLFSCSK